jgi:hypothetical protein
VNTLEQPFSFTRTAANGALLSLAVMLSVLVLSFHLSRAADREPSSLLKPTFAGEWSTTYGPMSLTQTGETIEGAYGPPSYRATIKGRLAGQRFTFHYVEPGAKGEGWFELADNGDSFRGEWREEGSKAWAEWSGRRVAAAVPSDFTGLWDTSYGRMRLRQNGTNVRGIYSFAGSARIFGTVKDRKLSFRYDQSNGEKGEGTFQLGSNAAAFAGTWKAATKAQQGDDAGGTWMGSRVRPQSGRIWLVVLESNWESSLEQEEYSFGVMLRTFFARVPSVGVRHRFFGSESELRRWCAELPYLAEPVVLYLSSHGTQQGLTSSGKTIGAEAIAQCIQDAGNLRLLHFGSCLIAGGDVPRKIHETLGPAATFPISGYTRTADWGGSAVVDFTYLDLIFSHGLSPGEAVTKTRQMLSFARDRSDQRDPIPPAGLVIFEPKPAGGK